MKKLGMIQIGAGGWGKTWLKFLHESEDWELAALTSRGGANLADARAQWGLGASQCFTDVDAALAVDADAVAITVPHHLHVPLARKALAAGKHVLVEKPLSDDFAAAKALVAEAGKSDRVLAVSQNFRYREGLWQMREAGAGAFGPVDSLRVELYQAQDENMPAWRARQVSPILLEIMIHHADMARFLLGADAERVWCRAWNPSWSVSKGPASVAVTVMFEGGATLVYSASWAARGRRTTWEGAWRVQFERGAAIWDGQAPVFADAADQLAPTPAAVGFPGRDRTGLLKDFARAVRGEAPFMTTGQDNLKSLAIVFAAIRSFQEGREVSLDEVL